MAEMSPEVPPPEGGGSFLTQRFYGIPAIVWLGGAAILAYFLFFRNKSGAASPSSSGGGGTSTTGDITFTPPSTAPVNTDTGAAVTNPANQGLNPGQPMISGAINPQPTPVVPGTTAVTASAIPIAARPANTPQRTYTVQKGDTLASIAKKFGISVATLAHANVYVPGEVPGNAKVGQPLGTGAGLLTGQVLNIP
jgi:LysM repeat protein